MEVIKDAPWQYRYQLVKLTGTVACSEQEDRKDLFLTGYVTINGVKAYALFDSGSTTDAISPDFTRVSNVPILRLKKPATLQLGCSGSRLKINFTTIAVVEFGLNTAKNYLDIANLNKYDCILGILFLRKHGISLYLEFQDIMICKGEHECRSPVAHHRYTHGKTHKYGNLRVRVTCHHRSTRIWVLFWMMQVLTPSTCVTMSLKYLIGVIIVENYNKIHVNTTKNK